MKMLKPEHYQIILNSIADGVFTVDFQKRITLFNKAAEDITGFKKEEALGKFCYEIFRSNLCCKDCIFDKITKLQKPIVNLTVNILTKDGDEKYVSISASPLKNKYGKIIGIVETFRDLSKIEEIEKEARKNYTYCDIISRNHKILEIFDILPDIAESDSTVMIIGESGTGKELFARAIHNLSSRKNRPFIAVNCAALPENLLESELFGYEKGAFTDAFRRKPGRFELAKDGTIFLDEIADMSLKLQAKLLRVIQEKEYEPLGSTRTYKVNVRIIAASNKDLKELMKKGLFREDLYYRLNVIKIELPPLRERKEDIPLLISHFIDKFNLRKGKKILGVTEEVMEILLNYDYPGNIRELENIIEYACVLCKEGWITIKHLPKEILNEVKIPKFEKEMDQIILALEKFGGNITKTAKALGIHRTTLWRKMKRLGLTKNSHTILALSKSCK